MNIIVHPECCYEVVAASDYAGSTKYIIDMIESAPSGSKWAIGTEMNLVNRIIQQHPDKEIVSLNPFMCPCLTMNRIDLPHLLWTLETIERGEEINVISVDKQVTTEAVLALNRMLELCKATVFPLLFHTYNHNENEMGIHCFEEIIVVLYAYSASNDIENRRSDKSEKKLMLFRKSYFMRFVTYR